MEMRRLEAVVKLEAAQKTKMTIGAKGLAKKKSQEFVTSNMTPAPQQPIAGETLSGPATPPKSDEPETKFVEINALADIDAETQGFVDDGHRPELQPFEDPQWLKLVKSVLNPEQFTKYEQSIAASKLDADKALVEYELARLSQELALSPDQESQLMPLILEFMAQDKPLPGREGQHYVVRRFVLEAEGNLLIYAISRIDSSKLQSILTPPQFDLFRIEVEILECRWGYLMPHMKEVPLGGN